MGRGKQACLVAAVMCLLGMPAEARHRGGHHQATTTTVTSASITTSTTTTTLPGTPPGFTMLDSALGALLDEVKAEPMSAHIQSELLKQIGHAQTDVTLAETSLTTHDRKAAKAALKHASRWMINFHYRVGSNSGRRGGANRTKLFALVDPIMTELRSLRRSI